MVWVSAPSTLRFCGSRDLIPRADVSGRGQSILAGPLPGLSERAGLVHTGDWGDNVCIQGSTWVHLAPPCLTLMTSSQTRHPESLLGRGVWVTRQRVVPGPAEMPAKSKGNLRQLTEEKSLHDWEMSLLP